MDGRLHGVERPPDGRLDGEAARAELDVLLRTIDGGFDWKDGTQAEPGEGQDPIDVALRALLELTPMEHVGREIYAITRPTRCDPTKLDRLAPVVSAPELQAIGSVTSPTSLDDVFATLGGASERSRRVIVAAGLAGALTCDSTEVTAKAPPRVPAAPRVEPPPANAPTAASTIDPPAPPEPAGDGERFDLKEFVRAKRQTLSHSTHYQVLEVARDASQAIIEDHYVRFLRKYHPDSYFRELDAETKDALEQLFVKLNDAYRTVSDATKRADYDRQLDEGAVFRSQLTEEDFLLAKTQLDAGKRQLDDGNWRAARGTLESARRSNPDSAEILAFLGKAFLEGGTANRVPDKARELIEMALEIEPERADFHGFLGDVHRVRGQHAEAADRYQAALKLDPSLREIEQLLKEERAHGSGASGGLLGGLFKGRKKE